MSETLADDENRDRSWLDNLIVFASDPGENGGTIVELRLRVTDPTKAASLHGIDISWEPERRAWVLAMGGDFEITETATIDTSGGNVREVLDAMDNERRRDQNVN